MWNLSETVRKNIKLLILGIGLALSVFIIMNWNYLWQNIKFKFVEPAPVSVTPEIIDYPTPSGEQTPTPTASGKSAPLSPIKFDPAGTLIIQSLGIKVPVMNVYEASERQFQAALIEGVVHYPGTAAAGQVGNDYIFGHSSDYIWSKGKYKTVFATLPKIQIGAEVILFDLAGNKYTYKVFETKIVMPSDTSVLQQDTGGRKILTVQTSYPVGTALKRFVAICELIQ